MENLALRISETCKIYGISRTFLYGEIKANRIRVRKAGRRTLIDPADAEAWFKSLPVQGEATTGEGRSDG